MPHGVVDEGDIHPRMWVKLNKEIDMYTSAFYASENDPHWVVGQYYYIDSLPGHLVIHGDNIPEYERTKDPTLLASI